MCHCWWPVGTGRQPSSPRNLLSFCAAVFNCCPFHHTSAKIHLSSSWNLKKPPGFCQNHLWCLVRSYCFPSFEDQPPSRNQMLPKWPKPVEIIHRHVWDMYKVYIYTHTWALCYDADSGFWEVPSNKVNTLSVFWLLAKAIPPLSNHLSSSKGSFLP